MCIRCRAVGLCVPVDPITDTLFHLQDGGRSVEVSKLNVSVLVDHAGAKGPGIERGRLIAGEDG